MALRGNDVLRFVISSWWHCYNLDWNLGYIRSAFFDVFRSPFPPTIATISLIFLLLGGVLVFRAFALSPYSSTPISISHFVSFLSTNFSLVIRILCGRR